MSLIEIIASYADATRKFGRIYAFHQVLSTCDSSIHDHIANSVNDRGEIIGAFGERFRIVKLESKVDWVDSLPENM